MTTYKKITLLALVCILTFAGGYLARLVYEKNPGTPSNTVVIQKSSSDGMFTAFILQDDASKEYRFAIEKKGGARLIADVDFVPAPGYHPPILSLSWNERNDEVIVEIDHDFGDNNVIYRFDTHTLKLLKN